MQNHPFAQKKPNSIKAAAARLAKADGASLNQFIVAAVTSKIGALEPTDSFLRQRAGNAKPDDLMPFLRKAHRHNPLHD